MISNLPTASQAYVWVWLPNQVDPVVAGKIKKENQKYTFRYSRNYLAKNDAISLSPFELPLEQGIFVPTGMNDIHSCLRDAAPDAWGRRVILHEYPKLNAGELDFMLLSGSNRIGGLDFQHSSSEYISRSSNKAALSDLLHAAELVEKGLPLPIELGKALLQGTSIGGARPKCLISDHNKQYIAKFSLNHDLYDIIKAEYIAMRLASFIPINVPNVHLTTILGKSILLVERFDRTYTKNGFLRHILLSGLSLLSLNELEARYASYSDLADIIRQHFASPEKELQELYKRLIFNVLIGNTDDHARNYSAFWDGKNLRLTPAYDLLPQLRSGQEASQAMIIGGIQGNLATLTNVLSVAEKFLLNQEEAKLLIDFQINTIKENWKTICEEAELSVVETRKLWQNAIFNPYCFYGWDYQ